MNRERGRHGRPEPDPVRHTARRLHHDLLSRLQDRDLPEDVALHGEQGAVRVHLQLCRGSGEGSTGQLRLVSPHPPFSINNKMLNFSLQRSTHSIFICLLCSVCARVRCLTTRCSATATSPRSGVWWTARVTALQHPRWDHYRHIGGAN